jgi:protein-S-isoprenylcysteine O-methyltransferase Ste14
MSEADWSGAAVLAVYWLGYFTLHSALASLRAKRWVAARHPGLMPEYRLGFNLLALLLLLPVLWLTQRYWGPMLWQWRGAGAWLANGLALAAVAGFVRSLSYYDTREFVGLRQWREHTRRVEDQEHFKLSPFHRFVRHPWYFFGLVLVWTRDVNAVLLVSNLAITLYFIIGSRLEERKLKVYHGLVYQRYMERVPGLLPLPWKWLSSSEAEALLADARRNNRNPQESKP